MHRTHKAAVSAGVAKFVQVFRGADSGALTIVTCTADGHIHTWLDHNVSTEPVHTHVAGGTVAAFTARPLTGADAPGYVALLSSESGQLTALLAGRRAVQAQPLTEQVSLSLAVMLGTLSLPGQRSQERARPLFRSWASSGVLLQRKHVIALSLSGSRMRASCSSQDDADLASLGREAARVTSCRYRNGSR